MSWSALSEDEVISRFTSTEEQLLQRAALASPGISPLADILSQVTNEVRGYIAAAKGNSLGASGTIPDEVRGAAIAMARWRLAGRVAVGSAGTLLQGETRRKEYEDALALLKDVAAGKMRVENPAAEIPVDAPSFGGDCKLEF